MHCQWRLASWKPNFFTGVGVNMCARLSVVPFKLQRSPYGVLGGLNRPSFGMLAWVVVVAWLGSVEHWLAREKTQRLLSYPFQQAVQHDWLLVYHSALCFPDVKKGGNHGGPSIIKPPLRVNERKGTFEAIFLCLLRFIHLSVSRVPIRLFSKSTAWCTLATPK